MYGLYLHCFALPPPQNVTNTAALKQHGQARLAGTLKKLLALDTAIGSVPQRSIVYST